jgi:hypothetical protein
MKSFLCDMPKISNRFHPVMMVVASLFAMPASSMGYWDEQLATSLLEEARYDEVLALCDLEIDGIHAIDEPTISDIKGVIQAGTMKIKALTSLDAPASEILGVVRTNLAMEANLEWRGWARYPEGTGQVFGPERIDYGVGLTGFQLSQGIDDPFLRSQLIAESASLVADSAMQRWLRIVDHPGTMFLIHDANMAIVDGQPFVKTKKDHRALFDAREVLIDVIDGMADRNLLRLRLNGSTDGLAEGDSALGSIVRHRMDNGPIDADLVASVKSWIDSIPDQSWRDQGGSFMGSIHTLIIRANQTRIPIPGVDELCDSLADIKRRIGLTRNSPVGVVASDRIDYAEAMVRAGRIEDARTLLSFVPVGLSPGIDGMRNVVARKIRKAEGPAQAEANIEVESPADSYLDEIMVSEVLESPSNLESKPDSARVDPLGSDPVSFNAPVTQVPSSPDSRSSFNLFIILLVILAGIVLVWYLRMKSPRISVDS